MADKIALLRLATPPHRGIEHRIDAVLAIFNAIEAGELLAALPECEHSRTQHMTALTLLAMAERELSALRSELVERLDMTIV